MNHHNELARRLYLASGYIDDTRDLLTLPLDHPRPEGIPVSEALLRALQQRATLNALVRRFFAERDVLEVETPILSVAGNTEPNIDSFHTDFTGHVDAGGRRRWLRTSPEYRSRLLAAGVGDCYELGRVFRNGEAAATTRNSPCWSGIGSAGTTTG